MIEDIWGEIIKWLKQEFIGAPKRSISNSIELYQDKSLFAETLRCESVHFLSSAALGWVVFCLMLIILSEKKSAWSEVSIFRCSFLFGLSASLTMHILIDGFTNIA